MSSDLGELMKQAQQMQDGIRRAQEEIAGMTVDGQAGAGLVRVTMNGQHRLTGVMLDDSLLGEDGDKETLQDLMAAAVNDATQRLAESSREKLSGLSAGLSLPDGLKLPS